MARREPKRVPRALTALAALAFLLVPASAEARFGDRALKKGSQGSDVKTLQKYLNRLGYRVSADGRYGTVTVRNVKRFERDKRRLVNGRVERPEAVIIKRLAAKSSSVKESNGGSAYSAPPKNATGKAKLQPDGTATAPEGAPERVKNAIAAANKIITKPYRYGGGHGSFEDSGYDCSGTVSYAMHGAGLLKQPLDSTGFMSWGRAGKGTWITTYAHGGHAYVVIAGLRLDTSGSGGKGPRWRSESRSPSGFTVRHPRGL
jgi:cell wall-associated NlpC family hydrolase